MTNHTHTRTGVMVQPCSATREITKDADVILLTPPPDEAGPARPTLTMTKDAAFNTALRIISACDPWRPEDNPEPASGGAGTDTPS